jgi:hypothetical protein
VTVTITAYKRPGLLRRCLESIAKADLSPVGNLFVQLDYHSPTMTEQMLKEAMSFRSKLAELGVFTNGMKTADRRGIANITRAAYACAFEDNADAAICAIEEDTTVSPDAFLFAEWALKQQPYAFVNLCSHQTPLGSDPTKVHEDNELRGGYGWAFTREFWEYLDPRWNGKNHAPYGWDWNVTYLCYREKWRVLTPEVSRVRHTGREGGTYTTPATFDATPQHVCDTVPEKYEIVKHELDYRQPAWVQAEMAP